MDWEGVKKKIFGSDAKCRSKRSKYQNLIGRLFGPFSFINISEGIEEVDTDGDSIRNLVEVAVVINIVQRLYKEWQCHRQKLSVCVVSPYVAQVQEIHRRLGNRYEKLDNFEWKVKSVENFHQGSEADVVILSTVKSSSVGSVRFSFDDPLYNIALTRARHCLWILGNGKTLAEAGSLWKDLISDAKECKCFFNAEEDKQLAQVIVDVKSKLYELEDLLDKGSNIFKSAIWKVVFSEIFVKSFAKLPSTYSKKLVVNFLLKLANGWRPKNKNTNVVCESSLRIAKQFKVEGRCIICTNDIVRAQGHATQILKVWDILHLAAVPALVEKIDKIYGALSVDFLSFCKEKCLQGNLEVPRCYTAFDVARYKGINSAGLTSFLDADNGGRNVENAKVKESLLLVKFYSLSARVSSQLLSASDGTALTVPFEVSDEERDIILFPKSSFILGRSGTGKTTVLVMKLFQKEQHHHISSEGFYERDVLMSGSMHNESGTSGSSLRQLFVTANPKLCSAVKQHIFNLRRFIHGEGYIPRDVNVLDDYEMFKDVPDSFEDIPSHAYPLVITLNMFLIMLDRTLGSSYFDKFPDIRKINSKETASSRLIAQIIRRKEVTYDKFRTSYWPNFNSQLTRKLDPSRVYTEIISCIKGRIHLWKSSDNILSLQTYLQLSKSRATNFRENEREVIYKIFEDYERKKVVLGEYDLADLVNDLRHRLKYEKYEGKYMDFVYIDEVQDLTMKQLSLFKYICGNVEEGFVFAGDTAQTIARGVDFRFQDVRHLFYEEFLYGVEAVGEERKKVKGTISPLFHLSQNFRTHAGVVNLAQSVVDLIYHFFPNSIDTLNPETSLLCGELPVFLDCGTNDNALLKIFQDKRSNSKNRISFGSEQVIMVRDDCARDKIANIIGEHALVLTIFECKGLEFEDVLLYNFFGSSPLKEQWRIIYEYMEKKLLLSDSKTYPNFIHSRHDVLCYELKQLYVAISRTRQRLWICEDRDGFSSPMTDYWQKLNLIRVERLDDSFAQTMQVADSLEDWRCRGVKMLEVCNYKAAVQCFHRSEDFDLKKFAMASDLKLAADNIQGFELENSKKMHREAAELFESIKNIKKAAECYFAAEDYVRAGDFYMQLDGELKIACHCYSLAGLHSRAAKLYAMHDLLSECLLACSSGKEFELGLKFIRSWKLLPYNVSIDLKTTEQEFLEKCALASYKNGDKRKMMEFVKDFISQDSVRTFLKSLGCYKELAELEIEWGNFSGCLDACDAGKLFELGLMYIRRWKLKLDGSIDLIANEQKFLMKCAHASYKNRDKRKMMEFVKDFSCQDSVRTFLKRFGYYKELLDLEEERGYYKEASEIASKIGYFIREADLLEKINNFQDASRLYSWYFFARSHWASGSKGWPERDYASKELLFKAKACARKDSSALHREIHLEILFLSSVNDGLSELKRKLVISQGIANFKWKIVFTRRILDTLLQMPVSLYSCNSESEDMICEGKVSIGTLIYFWNSWKEFILTTLRKIECVEESIAPNIYWDFCAHYFGVRKSPASDYFLLYPDAAWAAKLPRRSNGTVRTRDLVTAIRGYLCSELSSVGRNMLECFFESLQSSSYNSIAMSCKSRIFDHVSECARFLLNSEYLKQWGNASSAFKKVDRATKQYFTSMFFMEWHLLILQDQEKCCSSIITRKLKAKLRSFECMMYILIALLATP